MSIDSFIQSASAAAGAAVVVGAAARRYWVGREARQQIAFRAAVAQIVLEQTMELREILANQDRAIAELRRTVERRRR